MINPGIEVEIPIHTQSTLSGNAGVGYGLSYQSLKPSSINSFPYMIAPFLDIQYKHIYNQHQRVLDDKTVEFNGGNFWGIRLLTQGKPIASNFTRKSRLEFSAGPVWGIQRSYNHIHLLFGAGPIYYFDKNGHSGFFPVVAELNLGFDFGFLDPDCPCRK